MDQRTPIVSTVVVFLQYFQKQFIIKSDQIILHQINNRIICSESENVSDFQISNIFLRPLPTIWPLYYLLTHIRNAWLIQYYYYYTNRFFTIFFGKVWITNVILLVYLSAIVLKIFSGIVINSVVMLAERINFCTTKNYCQICRRLNSRSKIPSSQFGRFSLSLCYSQKQQQKSFVLWMDWILFFNLNNPFAYTFTRLLMRLSIFMFRCCSSRWFRLLPLCLATDFHKWATLIGFNLSAIEAIGNTHTHM